MCGRAGGSSPWYCPVHLWVGSLVQILSLIFPHRVGSPAQVPPHRAGPSVQTSMADFWIDFSVQTSPPTFDPPAQTPPSTVDFSIQILLVDSLLSSLVWVGSSPPASFSCVSLVHQRVHICLFNHFFMLCLLFLCGLSL